MRNSIAVGLIAGGAMLLAACSSDGPAVANVFTVTHDPETVDEEFPPAIIELGIDSHGDRMNGHIYLADGPGPHPTVVMLHGFPGNEKNLDLAHAIRRAGWNALYYPLSRCLGIGGNVQFQQRHRRRRLGAGFSARSGQ